ncbi:sodium:alanine symporter family protein [Cloacibacillus evryensis]|uniref:alanine/glycine:cation symporter family protein n=1 Tax=Cloacibacillus evryensis TaxID=508460 RepID=UPI0021095774|nr:amino acid carrier protein [Cloacibacillus evryensis]MCQ4765338.1 amino acid carrier protein [Cloacibacillus evryensis]
MLAFVENALSTLVDILWGPSLLVSLIGAGIWFTLITKFWPIRYFGKSMRQCLNMDKDVSISKAPGIVSPYQAASIAIAGAIGTGNIGGVASAIALGGPGVLFWMWVTAFVGMATKLVEITLAVYYRDKKANGDTWGGPTFYMEKGIGKRTRLWIPLAWTFGLGIMIQYFISLENFTVSEALTEASGINQVYTSLFYGFMCAIVVIGGFKKVAGFAAKMLPLMSVLYVAAGLFIIAVNANRLPEVFELILVKAFTPCAAIGGFAGASLLLAIRTGISRSLFSNEAGWGASPMAHASARTNHPVEQGLWGIFEVFVDTMVICTITAMVILVTGEWVSGEAGATLTMRSFRSGMGPMGFYFVAFIAFLFSWTTSTSWSSYFQTLLEHAFRSKPAMAAKIDRLMRICYVLPGILSTIFIVSIGIKTEIVWLVSDIATSLPTYVNLFAILFLTKKFLSILRDYEGKRVLWGKEIFYKYDKEI